MHETYDENGLLDKSLSYDENGDLHNNDGPSVIIYDIEGKPCYYLYYNHGNIHREDGPAVIIIDEQGVEDKLYFLDGEPYTDDYQINNWTEFCKYMKQLELYK